MMDRWRVDIKVDELMSEWMDGLVVWDGLAGWLVGLGG